MTLEELIEQANPSMQRLFACDCAERALLRERAEGREPHRDSWEAVRVARMFAEGRATEGELLKAAEEAALSAAWLAYSVGTVSYRATARAAQYAASTEEKFALHAAENSAYQATEDSAYRSPLNRVEVSRIAKKAEEAWQLQHLQSMLDALNPPRASLLFLFAQRQQRLSLAFLTRQSHLEEVLFDPC